MEPTGINRGVCECNRNISSTSRNIRLEIWNVQQQGLEVKIYDNESKTLVSEGIYENGKLTLSGVQGDWNFQASLSSADCCFDGNDVEGFHWHGVKWADDDEGCGTGWTVWKEDLIEQLEADSSLVQTAKGLIEYRIIGDDGPVLLVFHGGQGGYDEVYAFMAGLIGKGFRMLTWSRPGYLRTPLDVGLSPAEQADAAAALLDALDIDRVGIIGASAGGPPLYEFTLRYPQRIWALAPVAAVNQTYAAKNDDPVVASIGYLFTNDGGMWIFNSMLEYAFEATTRMLLASNSTLDEQTFDVWIDHIMADPERRELIWTAVRSFGPSLSRVEGYANDLEYDAELGYMPLGGITTPTLIVHGTNDGDVDPKHARYAHDAISDSQIYWVSDGTHLLMLSDESENMFSRILEFFNAHKPN
ncbi:alpha/beta hydrolase [uncultured Pseudodesulfovibrio sp.]|uniref:alpha/beta fold hydrolase n=1 Tax=uncultured Pseudodesulfovibrio sp. TaxID=2035858 RepID=UPI0029C757F1|nr:alpha/beta hydrolase [uncultured Pseudodesulfovibrio sp.]